MVSMCLMPFPQQPPLMWIIIQIYIFEGVDTFLLGQIKSDILNWKLQTLEAFFKLKYTTSLHFLLCKNILSNKIVIKLRSYICSSSTCSLVNKIIIERHPGVVSRTHTTLSMIKSMPRLSLCSGNQP
jgi:hypothetical protein